MSWGVMKSPPLRADELPRLKARKSRRPHRLPSGWRWLKNGEWVREGDMCCDPRCQPVEIQVNRAWQITEGCHPVRRDEEVYNPSILVGVLGRLPRGGGA